MKRRFFLFAAPAIVAAPSLMRVSTLSSAVLKSIDGFVTYTGEGTYTRYSGYEVVNITPEMIFTASRSNALLRWAIDRQHIIPA